MYDVSAGCYFVGERLEFESLIAVECFRSFPCVVITRGEKLVRGVGECLIHIYFKIECMASSLSNNFEVYKFGCVCLGKLETGGSS